MPLPARPAGWRPPVKRTSTALVLGCALVLPGYTGSIEEAADEASSGFPVAANGINVLEAAVSMPSEH
jgi:hypothetical protein